MFLGYSYIQKGYRCFYPQHQLYIVFADAIILDFPPSVLLLVYLMPISLRTFWIFQVLSQLQYSGFCLTFFANLPTMIKFRTKLHSTDPLTISSTPTTLLPTSYAPELPMELHTRIHCSRNPYPLHVCTFHFIVYLLPSLLCLCLRLCLFLSQ